MSRRNKLISTLAMQFFVTLCHRKSLSDTARDLDITPSAATKRLAHIEAELGVKLVNRTTRKVSLTSEGHMFFEHAQKILADIGRIEELMRKQTTKPSGTLTVNAPLGFGRRYLAPLISEFISEYPELEIRLTLSDHYFHLPDESVDIVIRLGEIPDSRVIARKIAPNRRILCASPKYLDQYGRPATPQDLSQHQVIALRQNDETANLWRLTRDDRTYSIKVPVRMSTNDGEVALKWALEGHGLLMRAQWDLAQYLRNGILESVLPEYKTPPADIYAVYLPTSTLAARVSMFLDYMEDAFLRGPDQPDFW